eukprot:1202443-Rhodomonas_salina.1
MVAEEGREEIWDTRRKTERNQSREEGEEDSEERGANETIGSPLQDSDFTVDEHGVEQSHPATMTRKDVVSGIIIKFSRVACQTRVD